MILGKYKISYQNGVKQEKNLISHSDFIDFIKPMQDLAYKLEIRLGRDNRHSGVIKSQIKNIFGSDWFTDQSPIFDSIQSGIINLLPQQGNHIVSITRLK